MSWKQRVITIDNLLEEIQGLKKEINLHNEDEDALSYRIQALEAENKRLKTNLQLLGDELNSLADRYDKLDDEKVKLEEVVEAAREIEKASVKFALIIGTHFKLDPILTFSDIREDYREFIEVVKKEALKGLEVEK